MSDRKSEVWRATSSGAKGHVTDSDPVPDKRTSSRVTAMYRKTKVGSPCWNTLKRSLLLHRKGRRKDVGCQE